MHSGIGFDERCLSNAYDINCFIGRAFSVSTTVYCRLYPGAHETDCQVVPVILSSDIQTFDDNNPETAMVLKKLNFCAAIVTHLSIPSDRH
jgi:hypothetical protein